MKTCSNCVLRLIAELSSCQVSLPAVIVSHRELLIIKSELKSVIMDEKIPVKIEENNFTHILLAVLVIIVTLGELRMNPYV
jgi:hypothetical protein